VRAHVGRVQYPPAQNQVHHGDGHGAPLLTGVLKCAHHLGVHEIRSYVGPTQKPRHGLERPNRIHQRRLKAIVADVDVRAEVDETLTAEAVPVLRGDVQGARPVALGHEHVWPRLDQRLEALVMALLGADKHALMKECVTLERERGRGEERPERSRPVGRRGVEDEREFFLGGQAVIWTSFEGSGELVTKVLAANEVKGEQAERRDARWLVVEYGQEVKDGRMDRVDCRLDVLSVPQGFFFFHVGDWCRKFRTDPCDDSGVA